MSTRNLKGWESLICPYFAETCRRAVSHYLKENGFQERGPNEIGGLVFLRLNVFLEISYELEMVPQDLTIIIGTEEGRYADRGRSCCVPYWYLLPQDYPEHKAGSTRFKTEYDLETLLVRLKNEVIDIYMKPLWLDADRLKKSIAAFHMESSRKG